MHAPPPSLFCVFCVPADFTVGESSGKVKGQTCHFVLTWRPLVR